MTHKSPPEFNLRQFDPLEKKMIAEIIFESTTPKKVNSAHLPPGKIYLEIEDPGKNHYQGTPLDFYVHTPACMDKKWNSPMTM